MRSLIAACAVLSCLLLAGASAGQDMDEDDCAYDRVMYPEGSELCQDGTLVRCEDGAWSDIGDCPVEAAPPPRTQGGDEDEPSN